jgi:hypothetical protein
VRADPDRRVRLLHREDVRMDVVQRPVLAVVGDRLLGPELLHQLQRLVEPAGPLLVGHVEVVELLGPVAETRAEDEPALGDDVEGGDLLGQHHGVVQRRDHDVGDQARARVAVGGEPGEQRHRLQPPQFPVEEVLADRDVVEALVLGHLHDPPDVLELLGGRDGLRGVAEQDAELDHGGALSISSGGCQA